MSRPDPIFTIDSAFFWEAAAGGTLAIQKCTGCLRLWHPPRPMCPECHSTDLAPAQMAGTGAVISWVRQIRPASFGFAQSPYVILIELDEGVRIVSNLVGETAPEFGMRVQVQFEKTAAGKAVPVFVPHLPREPDAG